MIIYIISALIFLIISTFVAWGVGKIICKIPELRLISVFISIFVSFAATAVSSFLVFYALPFLGFLSFGLYIIFLIPALILIVSFYLMMKRSILSFSFNQSFTLLFSVLFVASLIVFLDLVPFVNSKF